MRTHCKWWRCCSKAAAIFVSISRLSTDTVLHAHSAMMAGGRSAVLSIAAEQGFACIPPNSLVLPTAGGLTWSIVQKFPGRLTSLPSCRHSGPWLTTRSRRRR